MSAHPGVWSAAVFALMSWLAAGACAAPAASAPADATTVHGVTVEGRAQVALIQRRVDTFVHGMTTNSYDEALEVWRTPVCPAVAGMAREQAEFVVTRLSQIATAAGAPLAGKQCRPNFFVVATAQPDRLVKAWHQHDDGIFGRAYPGQIRRFIDTPRPVRVWRNADLNSPDGLALTGGASLALGGDTTGLGSLPTNAFSEDTRLKFNAVRNQVSVIVIIDVGRLTGVTFQQLADYVGMVGLTDVDLDSNVGEAPTILKLFADAGSARPAGLSDWDESFLKALYHTSQGLQMQRSEIAHNMLHDVTP